MIEMLAVPLSGTGFNQYIQLGPHCAVWFELHSDTLKLAPDNKFWMLYVLAVGSITPTLEEHEVMD